jgi:class 3 adenylate cyclase
VLATFDGPARAVDCACAIRDAVGDLGLKIRAGLHTGEIEMSDGDVHGIAVHIAARIMSLAGPREVLVSGVIPPLVLGSQLTFTDRGDHELKGRPRSVARLRGRRLALILGRERQPHLEPGTRGQIVRRQRAAMRLHQPRGDRQAKPRPAGQ